MEICITVLIIHEMTYKLGLQMSDLLHIVRKYQPYSGVSLRMGETGEY